MAQLLAYSVLLCVLAASSAAPAPQLLAALLGGGQGFQPGPNRPGGFDHPHGHQHRPNRPVGGGFGGGRPSGFAPQGGHPGGFAPGQHSPPPVQQAPVPAPAPAPVPAAPGGVPGSGGTAAGIGQATGGLFANAQGFGTNIPLGPLGGSVSIAESTALGVGNIRPGKPLGGNSSAGGAGTGSIGPDGQTNAGALSNANAEEGVAFGSSVGVALNLPALGIQQTFGQGAGVAVGK